MKPLIYFILETIIKMSFLVGALFTLFVLPYYILAETFTDYVLLDLLSIQMSMIIGIVFFIILNEIRKDCGRGVGVFFSLSKYKER
tara:strand:- start:472 stop:729 length:258 start_codon:yes stop_codon:yes gene_type:complete